jgi:hypothetical protein
LGAARVVGLVPPPPPHTHTSDCRRSVGTDLQGPAETSTGVCTSDHLSMNYDLAMEEESVQVIQLLLYYHHH